MKITLLLAVLDPSYFAVNMEANVDQQSRCDLILRARHSLSVKLGRSIPIIAVIRPAEREDPRSAHAIRASAKARSYVAISPPHDVLHLLPLPAD